MNWKAMFKGDFISAVEFDGKSPTLTIAKANMTEVFDEKTGRDKAKGTIWFKEIDRGWIVNKTNALCLVGMFGEETDGWVGKRVTLFAKLVKFGPKTEPGIRVKGSPDLKAPLTVTVKLPKKRPEDMVMEVTRASGASQKQTAQPQRAPEPPQDDAPPPGDDAWMNDAQS
jgi:hypothetical protein